MERCNMTVRVVIADNDAFKIRDNHKIHGFELCKTIYDEWMKNPECGAATIKIDKYGNDILYINNKTFVLPYDFKENVIHEYVELYKTVDIWMDLKNADLVTTSIATKIVRAPRWILPKVKQADRIVRTMMFEDAYHDYPLDGQIEYTMIEVCRNMHILEYVERLTNKE